MAVGRGAAGSSSSRPLVVAVDDDALLLEAVRDTLEPAGFAVETALDWREGFSLVRALRPSVVISDLMFGGDPKGWQLLQALLLDSPHQPPRLIVMSAFRHSLMEESARLGRAGIQVLLKPFGTEELVGLVRAASEGSTTPACSTTPA